MNSILRLFTNYRVIEIPEFRGIFYLSDYSKKMKRKVFGLAYIQITQNEPIKLLKEWHDEAKKFIFPGLMNLATADNSSVSNRNVVMREILPDGVTFCTPGKGKKCIQINENPSVAACFVWSYSTEDRRVSKQVRLEGVAERLPFEEVCRYFDNEPLYCKIRAHICEQGEPADWDKLKTKHDNLLKEVLETGRKLETPIDYTGYKIKPTSMEFYYAYDDHIADRILFKKEGETWGNQRICA